MSATPLTMNPGKVHQALTSYQLAMVLKGAIELDLFTHIGAGNKTAAAIAACCRGTAKGVRVVCDYLTVHGFLSKAGNEYSLLPDTAPLLDRASANYIGTVAHFFTHPAMVGKYRDVAGLVRDGGAFHDHTLAPNEPVWVDFARWMAPMFAMCAKIAAEHVIAMDAPCKVLDLAAGHGMFGIHIAERNPRADVVFQDWENVLAVARENVAARFTDASRFRFLAGDAFEVDFGGGYDAVLIPNFLHHFDREANVKLLQKVRAALKPEGVAAVIEFVPNEDRVSPPDGALFAMRMLGTTPAGDAYTFDEIAAMLRDAGFPKAEAISLAPAHQLLILGR